MHCCSPWNAKSCALEGKLLPPRSAPNCESQAKWFNMSVVACQIGLWVILEAHVRDKCAMGKSVAEQKAVAELRRWERLPLGIPVFVRGMDRRGKGFLEFTTALNVSNGGALLAIRQDLPRLSRVSLEIPSAPVPSMSAIPHFVRTREARLVRLAASNGCYLWGLKFNRAIK